MPALTRRRYPERHDCWHVYYGDVHAGTIARRTGIPHDEDPWGWSCGFYPGSHPGECTNGAAATFDQARAGFEAAWRVFLAKRTEADFQAWRDARDWTARKYAMWAAGERLPSQKPSSLMTCPCGEVFDSHRLEHTLVHVPHISAVALGTNGPAMACVLAPQPSIIPRRDHDQIDRPVAHMPVAAGMHGRSDGRRT